MSKGSKYSALAGGSAAAILAALAMAPAAYAQEQISSFNIPEQPLATALLDLGRQAHISVAAPHDMVAGKTARAVQGDLSTRDALVALLDGSGLHYDFVSATAVRITSDPQSGSAAGDGADAGTVAALIVTAQKKEENIQDVPIAISAFTEKSLQEQKIEGGFDLLKAIPNVTFSKNNFTSYNFSIRGVGTKAISATTDPGVAVSLNNVSLIQNRLFEQEYFDVERVEVLRGPQGTLYGRNATAGVINVISAKPNLQDFSGWIKGEVGNYHSKRLSAMVNIPLVEDKLGIRIAGALTDRQGYDYNTITKHAVNGRDLWSGRITVAFNPTDSIRSNLVWERFNEDDNRSRTGKQLCHRDPGPTEVGGVPTQQHDPRHNEPNGTNWADTMVPALFSQGCRPGSLYDPSAFETPNGLALNFVLGLLMSGGDCGAGCAAGLLWAGFDPTSGRNVTLLKTADPYGGMNQSPDLRVFASLRDPIYRAKADVLEFNFDADITPNITAYSQTVYDKDSVYSSQDYNRFNTLPVFNDTSGLVVYDNQFNLVPSQWRGVAPGGVYCDPQIGCSNTMVGVDISKAKSEQFTQEFRLQSSFDGPLNFSAGLNYTRFNVLVDYYVMFNLISAMAVFQPFNYQSDIHLCGYEAVVGPIYSGNWLDINDPSAWCVYVDPNPLDQINGEGHNYFRSKNPYKLKSGAVFGELYWQVNPDVKVTAGLRYTKDDKTFIPVPSQVLLSAHLIAGGTVNRGYPELPALKQSWGEFTGRLGLDWNTALPFTDRSMVYAFYSHGYKGGGMNPPGIGFTTETVASKLGIPPGVVPQLDRPMFNPPVNYPASFLPEFVNAFEVGAKNTILGGAATLNLGAFFYDYKDYQVSKIVDRTAVNENFDARVWGAELEFAVHPTTSLSFLANVGYLDTALGSGARSIDIMNRTQGNPNYVLMKPTPQLASNCIVPVHVARDYVSGGNFALNYSAFCGGWAFTANSAPYDPVMQGPYDAANYPEMNGGAGIYQNLKGNELPNSPHFTANLGGQYEMDMPAGWKATLRADAYWQSQSWARVYNAVNDKLHGWYNANLSLWLERPDDGLKIELYAKNIFDKTPITDAFINSDDTALTTNVFVLDPRLIGLSIKKDF